jgi:hypothetical protein
LQKKALYDVGFIFTGTLLMAGMILNTYREKSIARGSLISIHNLEAWSKAFIQEMENPSHLHELNVEAYAGFIREGIQFLTPSWITTFLTITGILLFAWFSYKVGVSSK